MAVIVLDVPAMARFICESCDPGFEAADDGVSCKSGRTRVSPTNQIRAPYSYYRPHGSPN